MNDYQYLMYLEDQLAKALDTRKRLSRVVDGKQEAWPSLDAEIKDLRERIFEIEMAASRRGKPYDL
jgi:hypothetical protein